MTMQCQSLCNVMPMPMQCNANAWPKQWQYNAKAMQHNAKAMQWQCNAMTMRCNDNAMPKRMQWNANANEMQCQCMSKAMAMQSQSKDNEKSQCHGPNYIKKYSHYWFYYTFSKPIHIFFYSQLQNLGGPKVDYFSGSNRPEKLTIFLKSWLFLVKNRPDFGSQKVYFLVVFF